MFSDFRAEMSPTAALKTDWSISRSVEGSVKWQWSDQYCQYMFMLIFDIQQSFCPSHDDCLPDVSQPRLYMLWYYYDIIWCINTEEVKYSSSQKCSLILIMSVFSLHTKDQSHTSASFVYFYVR